MSSRSARTSLVEALQLDLIGPGNDHACARELLPESPYKWYLTGFLMPTEAPESHRFDETSTEEVDQQVTPGGTDDAGPVDRAQGKSFLPSSIGLSVLLSPEAQGVELTVRWGDYEWEDEGGGDGSGERSDAPDAEDGVRREADPGDGGEDGEDAGESAGTLPRSPKGYRRIPREETVTLAVAELEGDEVRNIPLPGSGGLHLTAVRRPIRESESLGLPAGAAALSVFLVNYRSSQQKFVYRGCAFQTEVELRSERPFLDQPDLRGLGHVESQDWDERLADLQYRDVKEHAVGHGVATASLLDDDGECRRVRTAWMPSHEVERVASAEIGGVVFGMAALAALDAKEELRAALQPLVDQYRKWIEAQGAGLDALSPSRRETAVASLAEARAAADRMERGLETVCGDNDAFSAFRVANRAMARAATQRLKIEAPAWRPFQIAFILLNLRGLVEEGSEERSVVDLLFFPTGGGKTEAYLGLAAFTMVLRRLRHPNILSAGLSVLMRYTLRLLTLDQLGRAAGLVCALELERETNPALGAWPFEIGLWVGSAATPNRMGGRGYSGRGAEYTAYKKVSAFRRNSSSPSPIPLENCPWCGAKFGRNSFRFRPNETAPKDLRITCENRRCEFSGKRDLPILTVDEPIYRRLPAFLIATVDKFASLPWEGRAGALLGHVARHDSEGFYGAADPGPGNSFGGPLPGPDLIIQDELHLISGPLGTIAGVYETAIENLASRRKGEQVVRPKIVASTATVRRAHSQIQALFGRFNSAIFPPPGPDLRDTFFSVTHDIEESNGRLYLGIASQGRSLKVILMRAALVLLCASKKLYEKAGGTVAENPVDPYMTLLGYFNSLRELGGSRRIIEDEVVSRAQRYGGRLRRDPQLACFFDRLVDYEPRELTSRVSTAQVAETKRLLERCFHDDPKGGRPVDVALATNMISVGLDITRLGLMVMLGQPKGSSEYIQATSRVGRNPQRPGLVVALLNVHKPRDRSHYEHFALYHKTFYRAVEATSVTPFSPRSLDRALAAALVGVCRHSDPQLTPALGAGAIAAKRAELETMATAFAERARHHQADADAADQDRAHDRVLERCRDLLDTWEAIQHERQATGVALQYQDEQRGGNTARLLHDFLTDDLPSPTVSFRKFRANRSMRDVEPNVELRRKTLDEPVKP